MDDPTGLLVEPDDPDGSITKGFLNPLDALNVASPSAWVNLVILELTGVDVISWMTDWVGGDWQAIWKFGEAMGNLAEFAQQLGINIEQGTIAVERLWQGNASDAASQYFSDLAAAVSRLQLPLDEVGDRYHKAAVGAWQLSNQLGNILQALTDKAIIAGIAAAAGTVTAETGVGAVAGYGAAALVVVQMLSLINKASTLINTAGTVILGLFGTGMDLAYQGAIAELTAKSLPSVPYSYPGA